MRHHVRDGEIVGEEQVFKAQRAEKYQHTSGDAGLASALHQERMARSYRRDSAYERVHRTNEREQKRK